MVTKELKIKKYACFYASEFHLELILLPYIMHNMENSEIIILTQNNLEESINKILERTNLDEKKKLEIKNLNWKNKNGQIKQISKIDKSLNFIINGDKQYNKKINQEIENLNIKNYNIVDCFFIDNFKDEICNLKSKYDGILNTKSI